MKCGLSNGYISMIEKNENPATGKPLELSLPKIKAIAAAMNMTTDELIRMTDGNTLVSLGPEQSKAFENNHASFGFPRTVEARIVSAGMDKMSKEDREFALEMFRRAFASVYERKEDDADET